MILNIRNVIPGPAWLSRSATSASYALEGPPTQLTVAEQSVDKHLADRARDDIEVERLRARNEELERENRRLERENFALRSEVEELRAELAKRAPADDGLDIPPSLRRAPR